MELFSPDQIVLNETSLALLADVEETARRVNEYRPLPEDVVKRILDGLLGERVYSSNAIEGNTLDLRETISVLETGRLIENKKRDAIEARNLGEATRRISEIVPMGPAAHSLEHLFAIHKMILRESPDEYWGGRFRDQGVTITGAKYQPPDHTLVPSLVERVLEKLRQPTEVNGLVMACWAHWALARIHPFKDGNGRTARLLGDLVLFQSRLPCAIIRPEDRKEYLAALTHADEGDFNQLIQQASQRLLGTFDKYLAEIAADKELDAFAKELTGEADTRLSQRRELEYRKWARKFEQLKWEFEVCASRITKQAGRVRIQFRGYPPIGQADWELLASGTSVSKNWLFWLNFDLGERQVRYIFFFGKHHPNFLDNVIERSANRVCLLLSEDDGLGQGKRLDNLDSSPISIREVFLVDDSFVVRAKLPNGESTYERGVAPMRIAQEFIRDVVLRRLT